MATMDDVAVEAGVSVATVSRVLSNPRTVTEPKRRRVMEAIELLGYFPNAVARHLRTGRSRKLFVAIPYIGNDSSATIISGIQESAARAQYDVVVGETHHDDLRERHCLDMLRRREVDGLIFLSHLTRNSLSEFQPRGNLAPIVVGGLNRSDLGIPCAYIDTRAAAYTAMGHLYGLGHRRVGVITGLRESPVHVELLEGARVCAADCQAEPELVVEEGDFTIGSGEAAAARLLNRKTPPTALFCFNDEMAIGAMRYADSIGKLVPEHVSVIGFDDIRFASHVRPALTTISQPTLDIGRETLRLLLGILQGTLNGPLAIEMPFILKVRSSTAQPGLLVGLQGS